MRFTLSQGPHLENHSFLVPYPDFPSSSRILTLAQCYLLRAYRMPSPGILSSV